MDIEYRVINLEQPVTLTEYFRAITITNHSDESVWAKILVDNVDYL